jgi:ubiquinone biosynthesis protein UbiJ
MTSLTARQEAEAIEQFGDDLAALNRAFDKLCERLSPWAKDRLNEMPAILIADCADMVDTVAEAYRKLGDQLCRECDEADEADDRRRDNPFAPDHRRLGQ